MTDESLAIADRERQFHNERFSHATDPRAHLNKWYAAIRHGAEKQDAFVREHAAGKDVLEYGCADGGLSLLGLRLPDTCASLTGIDISEVAIEKATALAALHDYKNTNFLAMNAEAMTFKDESFDLVFGRGILHHLDLKKCLSEISRVLRKGGVAIFSEPMGHNPLLNFYRGRTPEIRTSDEHPLMVRDIELAKNYFSQVEIEFYGLFTVASVLLDPSARGMCYRVAKAVDDFILRFPPIGRHAWHCLIICRKA